MLGWERRRRVVPDSQADDRLIHLIEMECGLGDMMLLMMISGGIISSTYSDLIQKRYWHSKYFVMTHGWARQERRVSSRPFLHFSAQVDNHTD